MEPRTGRIVSWHLAGVILLMMMEAACGRAQYASPNGNDYATNAYSQPYQPGEVQSIWSGAPIIVNDNAFGAQEQARQPFSGFNEFYDGEAFRRPYPNWRREERAEWPTTRAPNHNYYNVPGYFFYQQPQQQQQPYPPASSELDSSDSRGEEEQVVQIGGSRSLATNNYQNVYPNSGANYFEPAQPWRPRGRDYEAKYAQHFANYLRKYPQRLRPVYQTGEDFVEK